MDMFKELMEKNPTAKIIYAVTWLDESGREVKDWLDEPKAREIFAQHAAENDDTQLYKALVIDLGDGKCDELHGEVIDSHEPTNQKTIYKSIITIEVLHEKPINMEEQTLARVISEIDDGDWSGKFSVTEQNIPLVGMNAVAATKAQGSDPEFFGMDDEGNETED
jgi:hypothetical protein